MCEASDHPLMREADRRMLQEPPRTWVFSTPFLSRDILDIPALVKILLGPFHGGADIPAQLLMQYVRHRTAGGSVVTSSWSAAVLADLDGLTTSIVIPAIVRCRSALMSVTGLLAGLTKCSALSPPLVESLLEKVTSMVANCMGIGFPHSLEECSEYFIMRAHLNSHNKQTMVTNIDKHWYDHYADMEPQVAFFKIHDLPTAGESAGAYFNG